MDKLTVRRQLARVHDRRHSAVGRAYLGRPAVNDREGVRHSESIGADVVAFTSQGRSGTTRRRRCTTTAPVRPELIHWEWTRFREALRIFWKLTAPCSLRSASCASRRATSARSTRDAFLATCSCQRSRGSAAMNQAIWPGFPRAEAKLPSGVCTLTSLPSHQSFTALMVVPHS